MDSTSSGVRAILRASQFSCRWSGELVPGIGSITGERASSQAIAICAGVARCFCGGRGQRWVRLSERAHAERKERQIGDVLRLAGREHGLGRLDLGVGHPRQRSAAASDVEQVLHGDDGRLLERLRELRGVDVAEREVPNFALFLQLDHRVERLEERHAAGRCDVAKVRDVEHVALEVTEIVLAAFAELLGPRERSPAFVGLSAFRRASTR